MDEPWSTPSNGEHFEQHWAESEREKASGLFLEKAWHLHAETKRFYMNLSSISHSVTHFSLSCAYRWRSCACKERGSSAEVVSWLVAAQGPWLHGPARCLGSIRGEIRRSRANLKAEAKWRFLPPSLPSLFSSLSLLSSVFPASSIFIQPHCKDVSSFTVLWVPFMTLEAVKALICLVWWDPTVEQQVGGGEPLPTLQWGAWEGAHRCKPCCQEHCTTQSKEMWKWKPSYIN